jgi:uncharacterized Fe-S center protein
MTVMVVNGNRYLVNDQSKGCDEACETILKTYPSDAQIEFDNVKKIDYERKIITRGVLKNSP